MLCDVQITWHGGVKQRAATALAETHITPSEPHCCQVPLLSEQCDSITGNNTSRNHALAYSRCPLLKPLRVWINSMSLFFQTRMQSLQPEPNAQYRGVYEALKRIIQTEGIFRPLRGLNITMMGAGPAHALYFACYERVKRSLSDIIQSGGNSHLANGTTSHVSTQITW